MSLGVFTFVDRMNRPLYDRIGVGYSNYRRPDARIASQITSALGPARTVLNIGAGAGSYEPADLSVVAVEPSAEMIRQRDPTAAPVIRAVAEHLPFRDGTFDATLAILTLHHWPDWQRGLRELCRVARDRVVIFTYDPQHHGFWLVQEYFPEILDIDRQSLPPLEAIQSMIGPTEIRPVLIPGDCSDGFLGAYWQRPEMYLDAGVRRAISSFSKLGNVRSGLERLKADLRTGRWDRRYPKLRAMSELDIGYRLLIAARSTPHA
jgi:SAM-dependent methyltransferase